MERKAITSKTIGIFQGKQAKWNEAILVTLYDYGPLTAWQITGKLTKHGKVSLHATLNKRLRDLEKKGYVFRQYKIWYLNFKGIITNLIIQSKPRIWSEKWTEIAEKRIKPRMQLMKFTKEFYDVGMATLKDFNAWVKLSRVAKRLLEEGVINLDVIKQTTLIGLLCMQTAEDYGNPIEDWLKYPKGKGE